MRSEWCERSACEVLSSRSFRGDRLWWAKERGGRLSSDLWLRSNVLSDLRCGLWSDLSLRSNVLSDLRCGLSSSSKASRDLRGMSLRSDLVARPPGRASSLSLGLALLNPIDLSPRFWSFLCLGRTYSSFFSHLLPPARELGNRSGPLLLPFSIDAVMDL